LTARPLRLKHGEVWSFLYEVSLWAHSPDQWVPPA